MTHRGPCQPPTFCDSVVLTEGHGPPSPTAWPGCMMSRETARKGDISNLCSVPKGGWCGLQPPAPARTPSALRGAGTGCAVCPASPSDVPAVIGLAAQKCVWLRGAYWVACVCLFFFSQISPTALGKSRAERNPSAGMRGVGLFPFSYLDSFELWPLNCTPSLSKFSLMALVLCCGAHPPSCRKEIIIILACKSIFFFPPLRTGEDAACSESLCRACAPLRCGWVGLFLLFWPGRGCGEFVRGRRLLPSSRAGDGEARAGLCSPPRSHVPVQKRAKPAAPHAVQWGFPAESWLGLAVAAEGGREASSAPSAHRLRQHLPFCASVEFLCPASSSASPGFATPRLTLAVETRALLPRCAWALPTMGASAALPAAAQRPEKREEMKEGGRGGVLPRWWSVSAQPSAVRISLLFMDAPDSSDAGRGAGQPRLRCGRSRQRRHCCGGDRGRAA